MIECSFEHDGAHYRFCEEKESLCETRLFDSDWLSTRGMLQRTLSHGRNAVDILNYRQSTLVCRRYYRGGVMRRISTDRYVRTRLSDSRAWREFDVLLRLQSLDLPSPKPYACRVVPSSLYYRASLITHYLASTQTLAETLSRHELSDQQWLDIGGCVKKFHDVGLDHSDLNANNILLDDRGRVFLIDFDKARFRHGAGDNWKRGNLKRLQRSIIKCGRNTEVFYFSPASWDLFRDGYGAT